ncbi:hypothetical protein F5X68DRAFT_261097 [Plectosphaerella plurivora]|uniref:HTH APSES-type domain-containing protein n=1 Tax=Plectosphaerella plurivora TaxID=936078 RepID=A0A9P8VE31_9PEZI|nr:hypothetical protein F5X68DRAFT_261097 [Plectosphaerella plurivora]
MLSLSSLLNPAPSGTLPPQCSITSSPTVSSPPTSYTDEVPVQKQQILHIQQQLPPSRPSVLATKFNMSKDPMVLSKSKPRGLINFYPFEGVDGEALREVRRFQVSPYGQILHSCLHIPYNSGKKDFYEKTGRESFEVFKYDFKVPGSDTTYTVMWDYNIGLVRMTPFFKCCKYGKTVPAKMLNQNPGLKEITHSITGGSISAQGYWMPFYCAKAVCATFCYEIAGALIPIFGPSFPAQCIPPGAHDFQRMVINPGIIYEAQKEADMSRRDYQQHTNMVVGNGGGNMGYSSAPERHDRRPLRPMRDADRRLRIDTRIQSPYSTDTEADGALSGPDSASSSSSGPRMYAYHAIPGPPRQHHQGWTPANHQPPFHATPPRSTYNDRRGGGDALAQPPSPWLSAIPRAPPPLTQHHHHHYPQQYHHRPSPPRSQPTPQPVSRPAKRPMDYEDEGYEGGESQNGSPALKYIADRRREESRFPPSEDTSEKKAALLLMNLSVQDQRRDREQTCLSDVDGGRSMPRVKRRRATSL